MRIAMALLISVWVFAASFLLVGCQEGGAGNPTATPGGTQASPLALVPEDGPIPFPQRLLTVGIDQYAADQILVKFKMTASNTAIQSAINTWDLRPLYHLTPIDWYLFSVPATEDVRNVKAGLAADPAVESVELNGIVSAQ